MNDRNLNTEVTGNMELYEAMDDIIPSDEWKEKLMDRVKSVKPYKSSVFSQIKFTIAIFLITILNIGIILTAIFNDSRQTLSRDNTLKIISKEMLVNPNSLNN